MSFHILGLGTAVPWHSLSQTTAMEVAKQFSTHTDEQRRLLPVLYRRTGVKRRHSVLLEPISESALISENSSSEKQEHGAEIPSAVLSAPASPLSDENLTQSFYPPAENEEDCGPTTSARMERYARHAGELAMRAAADALENSGLNPSQITHLVTVSCTGFQGPAWICS